MVELVRSGRTPEDLAREFEPTAQSISTSTSISTWVKQAERDAGKRAENSYLAVRRREHNMHRFKLVRQCQRFVSSHGPINSLFHVSRNHMTVVDHRQFQAVARATWRQITASVAD
ncbi:MAG: hypothetical protein ACK5JM_00970 [Rhodoblastus sp.]